MRSTRKPIRRGRLLALLALPLALAVSAPGLANPTTDTAVAPDRTSSGEQNGVGLMRIVVADKSGIDRLNELGVDLAEYVKPVDNGIEVHAILSPEESQSLRDMGFDVQDAISDQSDYAENVAERSTTVRALQALAASTDTLTVLRSEWFTSLDNQLFLNIEVKSSAGSDSTTVLTVSYDSGAGTEIGSGGTATLSRFTDAGQYMYHRFSNPLAIDKAPAKATITSNKGGSVTVDVAKWLGSPRKVTGDHPYVSDFVDHYMDPTEITARFTSLAAEFPKLTQLIDLPYKTNGYRRQAQAQFGTATASIVYVTSKAYGSEGGNDITMSLVNPGAANAPLTVGVSGKAVTVNLATNGSGAITSTAAQVANAVNGNADAAKLLTASTYRGNAGAGAVAAAAATKLTDNLKAPASVSRDPFQMKVLRIGKHRDGSKVGVFLYCQEHAREWVTPLVCVESAERLLRNYAQDPNTRKIVDDLDIFILPVVNPDGAHYSMYDYNMQRRNMTNYCPASSADPANRNAWGVDINRNFSVGSVYDGYNGGSTSCTSDTYSGPSKLSEPEARNEVWLVDNFPNIKLSMNTHSYGGYFMWPPGAYKTAGREVLPRVDQGTEAFFWTSSDYILSRVQEYRGTAIWPGRTGPVTDVLYSAAGNSADEHWYNRGIIGWDFEVGADVYNPTTKRFTAVGFQPTFAEGHEEAMEFANGNIGILEVARAYATDKIQPKSTVKIVSQQPGATTFTFTTSEPANVYYTLDGSRPTFNSPKLALAGMREGVQNLTVNSNTTINWFSVDIAGNVESNYKPDGNGKNYNKQTVTVN
ncbi:Chitobiase/beta-hexosaminidase C-terminal domain-containing protein [Micromonospora narathiwatensis]|uniref:Zinc carboxypeptidase n=1 Tax=Micromonospora narathiwatensis TaxID=299146 RepID=A0A1A9AFY4_9ACTN|nr:Chitobiase/beta-hexosaminidase C-terminal domain-containing protein [Micromonospora narathiwatensis]